jgi:hypothetical protein
LEQTHRHNEKEGRIGDDYLVSKDVV